MKLDNPLVVQWEYASEDRLAARNPTYRALVEGANPEELWELLGGEPTTGLSFDHDNGAAVLGAQFGNVETREANGTVVFPDRETMRVFVAATTTRSHLAGNVPELAEPFRTRSAHVIFVAGK